MRTQFYWNLQCGKAIKKIEPSYHTVAGACIKYALLGMYIYVRNEYVWMR